MHGEEHGWGAGLGRSARRQACLLATLGDKSLMRAHRACLVILPATQRAPACPESSPHPHLAQPITSVPPDLLDSADVLPFSANLAGPLLFARAPVDGQQRGAGALQHQRVLHGALHRGSCGVGGRATWCTEGAKLPQKHPPRALEGEHARQQARWPSTCQCSYTAAPPGRQARCIGVGAKPAWEARASPQHAPQKGGAAP